MAHLRRPLGAALALNTVVFIVESVAGLKANSLSLMMDAAHNLSDEVAILLLFLAYVMPSGLSGTLIWSASFVRQSTRIAQDNDSGLNHGAGDLVRPITISVMRIRRLLCQVYNCHK